MSSTITWQDAVEMGHDGSDTEFSLTFRNWQVAELIGEARSPLVGALAAIIADPDCCAASKAIARDALSEKGQRISNAEAALDEMVATAQAAGDYGEPRCKPQDTGGHMTNDAMAATVTISQEEFLVACRRYLEEGLWGKLEAVGCRIYDEARWSGGRVSGEDLGALAAVLREIDRRRKCQFAAEVKWRGEQQRTAALNTLLDIDGPLYGGENGEA